MICPVCNHDNPDKPNVLGQVCEYCGYCFKSGIKDITPLEILEAIRKVALDPSYDDLTYGEAMALHKIQNILRGVEK